MTGWPTDPRERVLALHEAGYHLIPMKTEGDAKSPAIRWKEQQTEQLSRGMIEGWLDTGTTEWALVAGTEKRIICLDFEKYEIALFEPIIARFPATSVVTSVSGGKHVWVEVTEGDVPRSHQICKRWLGTWKKKKDGSESNSPNYTLLAEIRGAGGYAVIVGEKRVASPDWAPAPMTYRELDDVVTQIAALGDDMDQIRREHAVGTPEGDYRAEGSADLWRAQQDQARFLVSVMEYPEDLNWHLTEVWDDAYFRRQEWRARCPVHTGDGEEHSDTSLSWGIKVGGDRPRFVWHCHANCSNGDIADVLEFALAPSKDSTYEDDVEKEMYTQRVRTDAKERLRSSGESTRLPEVKLLSSIVVQPMEWRIAPIDPSEVTGLMPIDGTMLLIAERKAGKSSVAFQLAKGYTSGGVVLGAWKCKPLPADERVAYINYEVSENQATTWALETGCDGDRMVLINGRGKRNPLLHETDRVQLAKDLKALNVTVLFLDPLGRALKSGENAENDAGEINAFFNTLEQVAEMAGVRELVVIAHAGKSHFKARGSSAIEGWADSLVYLRKDEETHERYLKAEGRDVDVIEAKLAWDAETRTNAYVPGDKPKTKIAKKTDARRKEIIWAIEQVMRTHPDGLSINAIVKALKALEPDPVDTTNATVSRYLHEDGDTFVEHNTKWFTWKRALELGYVKPTDEDPLAEPEDDGPEGWE